MIKTARAITPFDWMRAYTALSRRGIVTDAIRACEETWGSRFDGEPEAVAAIRRLPEYEAYVRALRDSLHFPLTLYRVTTQAFYEAWLGGDLHRPVSASLSLDFVRIIREVYPLRCDGLILITGEVVSPDAVLMRGRLEGYELVVDSGRVRPTDVKLLEP